MKKRRSGITLGLAALALGGCVAAGPTAEPGLSADRSVPVEVLALAAAYQNLGAIEFRPEDGCYWYWHDGPVETTLLPLRTPAGNPICRASA
ncbi:hypothetical protein [uncultured Jannaschia sp.]|uniref:hypothetical protein n=1 Tax=uncultured Jannaschia sp. TaxID=293347 RepID=UPI00263312D4|nr:hypothetical protein [uncultured Jannaschia sp.]